MQDGDKIAECLAYNQEMIGNCEFFEKSEDSKEIVCCVHAYWIDVDVTECKCEEAKRAALLDYRIELL